MNQSPYPLAPEGSSPRRFASWSKLGGGPLTFAILIHVIVLTLGGIWIFQVIRPPVQKDHLFTGRASGDNPGLTTAPSKTAPVKSSHITPAADLKRIAVDDARATIALPDPGDRFGEKTSLDALTQGGLSGLTGGPGTDKGIGIHQNPPGIEGKNPFPGINLIYGGRCSKADRLQRLKDNGGTAACEEAVVKGTQWLKAHQNPDGSWGNSHQAAMTGLALLAYFGHCETPDSKEFGQSCVNGMAYLINLALKNQGRITTNPSDKTWPYEHAIATYALAEGLTFSKEIKFDMPGLLESVESAGQFIIDHQHVNGGWSYLYATKDGHPDVSVSGWQIQALKACSHTNIKYRGMPTCINKALAYIESCQKESGGFGYTSAQDGERDGYDTLTGVGILCNQMWDKGASQIRKASKYVIQNTKFDYNNSYADLYGHYYESQAMMRRGGPDWKTYNDLFRDQVLNNQDADGSWKIPGGGQKIRGVGAELVNNKIYRTCLCTLMLEVYYRFLNTGTGGREHSGL